MSQHRSNQPPPRSPQSSKSNRSDKLERTLGELENAFADWNSLAANPAPTVDPVAPQTSNKSKSEAEIREKTQKLLVELRRQLEELASDSE